MLEKTKKRVVYIATYKGADGNTKMNVNLVMLHPNTSWHLDQFGEEDNEVGDYKLTRLGKEETRLDMVFKETWKNIAQVPSLQEQISSTNRVWDKYVSALEQEYQAGLRGK